MLENIICYSLVLSIISKIYFLLYSYFLYTLIITEKELFYVSSNIPFVNIPDYPPLENILSTIKQNPHHVLLDVESLAKEAGAPQQASNMVLLGAALPMLGMELDLIVAGVKNVFSRKGEDIVNKNLAALIAGYNHTKNNIVN